MAQIRDLLVTGTSRFLGKVYATQIIANLTGNADTATSATKATQDESGNNIKSSYASSIDISDHTITLKNKNGDSLGDVTVPDNNTWRPLGTTADTACAGNDSRLSNARPASDVYAWAKASTKPSYSYSEISGTPSSLPANGGTSEYANKVWTQSHNGSWYINSNWDGSYFQTNCKDTNGNILPIKVNNSGYADSAGSVEWGNVTGKPSNYTPSSHTHDNASSSAAGFMTSRYYDNLYNLISTSVTKMGTSLPTSYGRVLKLSDPIYTTGSDAYAIGVGSNKKLYTYFGNNGSTTAAWSQVSMNDDSRAFICVKSGNGARISTIVTATDSPSKNAFVMDDIRIRTVMNGSYAAAETGTVEPFRSSSASSLLEYVKLKLAGNQANWTVSNQQSSSLGSNQYLCSVNIINRMHTALSNTKYITVEYNPALTSVSIVS